MAEPKKKIPLKRCRAAVGYTQTDFAEALNVSLSTVVNWEHGKFLPTIDKAYEIADLVGRKIDDIDFSHKS